MENLNMEIIRTENLTRVYSIGDVEVKALRGISLSIEKGDFVAIMGPSGSGKSTLMNILGCLDRPTGGNYFIEGKNVNNMSSHKLADIRNQKIGFVFQSYNLLPRTTALENVELPLFYNRLRSKEDYTKTAIRALERVSLADRFSHRPSQLSGGQQQRVAIARALVNEPPIILADEPTGNLDSKTTLEIISLFQKLNLQGITIVLVTHEHDIALYTKRIVELKDGTVLRDERVKRPIVSSNSNNEKAPEYVDTLDGTI
jgi:putative ABC transport system ATP-binding protein